MHHTEEYSSTSSTALTWIRLATAVAKDGEMSHFDAEQAFLEASVDEEICI